MTDLLHASTDSLDASQNSSMSPRKTIFSGGLTMIFSFLAPQFPKFNSSFPFCSSDITQSRKSENAWGSQFCFSFFSPKCVSATTMMLFFASISCAGSILRFSKFLLKSTPTAKQRALTDHILRGQLNNIKSEMGSWKRKVHTHSQHPTYSIQRPKIKLDIIKKRFHFSG